MPTTLTTPYGTELVVDEPVEHFTTVLRGDPGAFGRWFEAHVSGEPRLVNGQHVFTMRPSPSKPAAKAKA